LGRRKIEGRREAETKILLTERCQKFSLPGLWWGRPPTVSSDLSNEQSYPKHPRPLSPEKYARSIDLEVQRRLVFVVASHSVASLP
jgi:hypothetical protein